MGHVPTTNTQCVNDDSKERKTVKQNTSFSASRESSGRGRWNQIALVQAHGKYLQQLVYLPRASATPSIQDEGRPEKSGRFIVDGTSDPVASSRWSPIGEDVPRKLVDFSGRHRKLLDNC